MSDLNDDFDFDDELPELDLDDLDFLDEEKVDSNTYLPVKKSSEITRYEETEDEFDDDNLDNLIKFEAMKVFDNDEDWSLPSKFIPQDDTGVDDNAEYFDYTEDDFEDSGKKPKKKRKALKIIIIIIAVLLAIAAFLAFTLPGRRIVYWFAGKWIEWHVNGNIDDEEDIWGDSAYDDAENPEESELADGTELPEEIVKNDDTSRSDEDVKTYLLFGIEEIGGASNTDAIMLLSVNKKDNTLKLTSIMRDTYVDIPGFRSNKINAAYADGRQVGSTKEERNKNGATLVMNVIENTFDIDITGYLSVNFKSFEKIVDRLGGIDINLGEKEAAYLRKTNYISDPNNRGSIKAGINHMNGNQVLGYSRVRKVPNVNGTNYDYGRTERHRMVIDAIIQQYKSLSLPQMYSVMSDCLQYVQTDLTGEDFSEIIENVVENKIFTVKQMRLPIDGMFTDSGKKAIDNGSKSGVTYALVIGKYMDKTIKKFHNFVFLDNKSGKKEEEAK